MIDILGIKNINNKEHTVTMTDVKIIYLLLFYYIFIYYIYIIYLFIIYYYYYVRNVDVSVKI